MKKFFPLCLIAILLCWSVASADLSPSQSSSGISKMHGISTSNVANMDDVELEINDDVVNGDLIYNNVDPNGSEDIAPVTRSGGGNLPIITDFQDSLYTFPLDTLTDTQFLGIEYDGTNFWITGGNSGADPNKLYKLDDTGALLATYDQTGTVGWGWRDLAWDGTYLYGSDDGVIDQIDPATGNITGVTINGPESPNRGLAYDPVTDHFWTANFGGPIYEFQRDGTINNTFGNSLGGIYGLAWDTLSGDGPWLWVFSQDGPGVDTLLQISQFDPVAGTYTGVSFQGDVPTGYTGGVAGGACITYDWDNSSEAIFVLGQGNPTDFVYGYDLWPMSQILGSCCNDANGSCIDNVLQVDCPSQARWTGNTLCADLQPACGDLAPCSLVCDTPLEAEPDCYDDYDDVTNGGCNSTVPVFTNMTIGDTICGTSGTFINLPDTNSRDTDWYKVVVTADGALSWTVVADFDVLIFIIDAGTEDCLDYSILGNVSALACSTATLSFPVTPGVYWLWVGPSDFTGVPCGAIYTAHSELSEPPTGACCVGDVCVATNTQSECDALQGDWFIGEDCSSFQCDAFSLTCDPQALFGQDPTPPTGNWTIANSEGPEYRVFDDFTGVADSIGDLHWWGSPLYFSGGWSACVENPMDFTIGFYPDLAGIPDTANPTCFYNATVTGVPTGRVYAGFALEYYYSTTIDPCCDISDGWVSIVGWGDSTCWFLWMSSGDSDLGFSYQQQQDSLVATTYDLSFCLTPCEGEVIGRCCYETPLTVECADNTLSECNALQGTWSSGLNCTNDPCPVGGDCDYAIGDVNGSDSYNGLDITYGVAFFKGGNAPLCDPDCPPCAGWNYCGDVNGSCSYNGLDITYGVAYFKGGNDPIPCADCPPSP